MEPVEKVMLQRGVAHRVAVPSIEMRNQQQKTTTYQQKSATHQQKESKTTGSAVSGGISTTESVPHYSITTTLL